MKSSKKFSSELGRGPGERGNKVASCNFNGGAMKSFPLPTVTHSARSVAQRRRANRRANARTNSLPLAGQRVKVASSSPTFTQSESVSRESCWCAGPFVHSLAHTLAASDSPVVNLPMANFLQVSNGFPVKRLNWTDRRTGQTDESN